MCATLLCVLYYKLFKVIFKAHEISYWLNDFALIMDLLGMMKGKCTKEDMQDDNGEDKHMSIALRKSTS